MFGYFSNKKSASISKLFSFSRLHPKLDYRSIKMSYGVLFTTYASLISKKQKPKCDELACRLDQIVDWVGGEEFEGVIVFDESHKAKNLIPEKSGKPTKTGQAVERLQARMPNARVVYASAAGASD